MRHLLEARLVNEPFGDPGLFVDLRDERRALLIDLGDLAAVPPRKLMRLTHVFVSHAHMDHFVGFDTLLRVVLGRKERLTLVGGPGFVAQVGHKLQAYAWNVVHRYAMPLTLEVREVDPEGRGRAARYSSRDGFARHDEAPFDVVGDVLLDEPLLGVRGRFVDHEMPCLAFAVEEKPRPRVAKDRLARLGVATGPWLRELRAAVLAGAPATAPIELRWRDRDGTHEERRSVGELAAALLEPTAGRRIGYVTDLRYTEANLRTLDALLAGVDELFIESPFLDAERAQAERKNHLTARQAGLIACRLGARYVVPFHFSPRYRPDAAALVGEVGAAWQGRSEDDAGVTGTAGEPPQGLADDRWTRELR
jgi:ribonuclease Z